MSENKEKYEPRLQRLYEEEIVPEMMRRFGYTNRMAVPRIEKVVVNMGVGKATQDRKLLDSACKDLATITGQKALITRGRKSVSGFKLRQGMPIGCKVTVRGERMYDFLDRLISIALPRIRDFRGLNPGGFDGHGNYTLGLGEQIVFPEIDIDKVENVQGMHITLAISKSSDEESFALLDLMGMPFRKKGSTLGAQVSD